MNVALRNSGPDPIDTFLLVVYLIGIYLGFEVRLTQSIPIPTTISGAAGALLLIKHMHRMQERHLFCLLLVVLLYLGAILSAADYAYLSKRFTGLAQIAYSFVIGYAFYLTGLLHDRRHLAQIFLWFCIAILVGTALENYVEAVRNLSDAARGYLYLSGIYDSDLRDVLLYGRVRPKLFTSEPSAVTFGFALFSFAWYVLSTWRGKLVIYCVLLAVAFYLMRGPTLMLGLLLVPAYEVLLGSRTRTAEGMSYDPVRAGVALMVSMVAIVLGYYLSQTLYAERIDDIQAGSDPSFFSRIIAPFEVAMDTMMRHPLAGIGLTAEGAIEERVRQIYEQAPQLSSVWNFDKAANAITNYFWTHWIYLGAVWGCIMLLGLSLLLRALGVPSILFCWSVWIVFGHASGAYVSPKTWTVMYLAAVISILHERQWLSVPSDAARTAPFQVPMPAFMPRFR